VYAVTEETETQGQRARGNAYKHEYCTNRSTSTLTRAPIHRCFRHHTRRTLYQYSIVLVRKRSLPRPEATSMIMKLECRCYSLA
jgi:hypothetical protein